MKTDLLIGFTFTLYIVLAIEESRITIGIVANGTKKVENELFSRNGQQLVMVKHLVNTLEIYQILRSVKILDADPNVDVILVLDYDRNLLKMSHILDAHNKKLIRLGHRSSKTVDNSMITAREKLNTLTSRTNPCYNDHHDGAAYCLKQINSTLYSRDDALMRKPELLGVCSIVKSLKWRSITIFYENSTEWHITTLVDGFSNDGILVTLFNIDNIANKQTMLQKLYHKHVEVHKEMTISLTTVCGLSNTQVILNAANDFDLLNNQKTLLKILSRWLIVIYGYDRDAPRIIQQSAKDIDNIAVVAVPKPKHIDMKTLYKGIACTSLEIHIENFGSDHISFKDMFINRLEKNAKSWNPTNFCQGYYINTLLWKDNGRQLSTVGHVDFNGKVVLNSKIFPNIDNGYNKRSFLISTLEYETFVIKRKENNSTIFEGFCMDLLHELASKLNFTYTLTEPADGKWGAVTNRINLTFNGLVGQLQREEVDIVAAPLSIQAERDPVMDFSYPYYYQYTTVLVKKPDINSTKWRTLVDPLKWEVLLSIGASLLVVTVLIFLLEKKNPLYSAPDHACEREGNDGLQTLNSSFWYVFGALLCQVTREKPPFNSLQEMIELKGTYKWGTIGGTAWTSTLPKSSNKIFRTMGEAFIEFNKTDPTILHQSPSFHVKRVIKGHYAFIGDRTAIEIAMATECSLMTIKEEFMPLIYIFGFRENSPHAAIFSEQMIKIHESGLFEIWKRKWWPKSSSCSAKSRTDAKPISLMDVQSAFYVCVIGVFTGLFAFMTEIIVHKCRSRKKLTNESKPDDSKRKPTSLQIERTSD